MCFDSLLYRAGLRPGKVSNQKTTLGVHVTMSAAGLLLLPLSKTKKALFCGVCLGLSKILQIKLLTNKCNCNRIETKKEIGECKEDGRSKESVCIHKSID